MAGLYIRVYIVTSSLLMNAKRGEFSGADRVLHLNNIDTKFHINKLYKMSPRSYKFTYFHKSVIEEIFEA